MNPHATRQRSDGVPSTHQPTPTIPPAARLVIAILHQAAHDLAHGDPAARVFVHSTDFDYYCDLIGANPGYLRRLFVRHAWLAPIEAHP